MEEALRGPFGETPPPPGPPLGPHFGPPLGPPIGPPLGPPLGPLEACREYNSNHSLHTADYELAETPKVIAGALTFFVVLPFVLFHFPFFPIGPTAIVLTGACLMVITGVITQDEAYEVLGQKENLTTLFLLLGMMLLAQFFERELIINKFLCKVLRKDTTFEKYVLWICLMTFPLAALFTNDVTCVIITPMILKVWKKQKRARVELDIVLLAIATSADIGSVTTTFGNPQMALIAAKTIPPVYHQSRLDLHRCLVFLLFPAVIGLGVNYVLLVAFYRWRSNRLGNKNNMDADENITIETPNIPHDKLPGKIGELPEIVIPSPSKNHPDEVGGKRDDETNSIFLTRQEENENRIQRGSFCISGQTMGALHRAPKTSSETLPHSEKGSCPLADSAAQMADMSKVSANLAGCQTGSDAFLSEFTPKSKNNLGTPCKTKDMHHFAPSDSSLFRTILFCLLVMAMFGFFFSGNLIHVNMGLLSVGVAVILLLADALTNKRNALTAIKRIDWSILVLFMGMFVWLYGLNSTRIPRWFWRKLDLAGKPIDTASRIAIACTFIVFGSNIFSNVPLTMIVLEMLEPCRNQLALVIYLAWCGTIAGNLTLFGSVSNLIVSQKAMETVQHPLKFTTYLKFGFVTTLVIIISGILILFGILQVANV